LIYDIKVKIILVVLYFKLFVKKKN
jgi:hypothetical protein